MSLLITIWSRPNKNPTRSSGVSCLQSVGSGISSTRSCCSTDRLQHVHQRKAVSRTPFHLFRLQSSEQQCNHRAHRRRLGLDSPLAFLMTVSFLRQVALMLIPQLGALSTFLNSMRWTFIQWIRLWMFNKVQNFCCSPGCTIARWRDVFCSVLEEPCSNFFL